MLRKRALLAFSLSLLVMALVLPDPVEADDCDPTGTRFFKTSLAATNLYYCTGPGYTPNPADPCPPPPEQNWCFLGEYNPPTTCCNGYHEETQPENECYGCAYCRDVEFVCD
jgi:hypothetical protein